jgi:hypothetical protein
MFFVDIVADNGITCLDNALHRRSIIILFLPDVKSRYYQGTNNKKANTGDNYNAPDPCTKRNVVAHFICPAL